MKNYFILLMAVLVLVTACTKKNPDPVENDLPDGVFIVNQGTFNSANASLSYFETSNKVLHNSLFEEVNQVSLGDIAQSIVVRNDLSYIVVNNSGLIYCIDNKKASFQGKISGLTSPRNIIFINDEKAYVSDLYSKDITIVNPKTFEITGEISVSRTSEEMVKVDDKVYVANWSAYSQELKNDVIMVISTNVDELVDTIKVGIEPNSLVVDKDNNIWALCSGGYMNEENPTLWKINGANGEIIKTFTFGVLESNPIGLRINGGGNKLYFLNEGVFSMSVADDQLPGSPLINQDNGKAFSCLGIDPVNGDLYAGDPVDYQSEGIVYHYSETGELIDELQVGIVPGAFGFNY
jgi:glutamine cyclotransferase